MQPKPLHKSRTFWSVAIAAVAGLAGFVPQLPHQIAAILPFLPDNVQRWLRLLSATAVLLSVVFARLASQDVQEALAGEKAAFTALTPN